MKDKETFQLLKLGVVANTFEWYEYIIYAYLASYLGQLFFNETTPIVSMIKAFALFAFANLMRPIGAYFFGHLSDRTSRKHALTWALYLTAIPTVLIGLLPTYSTIGFAAPLLLTGLRFMQGFAMGGEFPSNICYIFEHAPSKYRNILMSLMPASPTIGLLLGSGVITVLLWSFDHDTIMEWAWRIPFLLGAPLALCIGYIRRAFDLIPEPPKVVDKPIETQRSFFKKGNLMLLFQGCILIGFGSIVTAICQVWMPFYLTHFLHYPAEKAQLLNTILLVSCFLFYFITGMVANVFGSKKVLLSTVLSAIFFIFPLFWMLYQKNYAVSIGVHLGFAWLMSSHGGVIFRILSELFQETLRARGVGLAWTLPMPLLGGTAPILCAAVIEKTNMLMFPAFYIMAYSLLIIPVVLRLPSLNRPSSERSSSTQTRR